MSYQTSSKRSPPFWLLIGARKLVFSGTNQKPERRRPFGTGLVRHCPQGLFSPFFTFLRAIYFSARLDFSSSPLSAPGSPRMEQPMLIQIHSTAYDVISCNDQRCPENSLRNHVPLPTYHSSHLSDLVIVIMQDISIAIFHIPLLNLFLSL